MSETHATIVIDRDEIERAFAQHWPACPTCHSEAAVAVTWTPGAEHLVTWDVVEPHALDCQNPNNPNRTGTPA